MKDLGFCLACLLLVATLFPETAGRKVGEAVAAYHRAVQAGGQP